MNITKYMNKYIVDDDIINYEYIEDTEDNLKTTVEAIILEWMVIKIIYYVEKEESYNYELIDDYTDIS